MYKYKYFLTGFFMFITVQLCLVLSNNVLARESFMGPTGGTGGKFFTLYPSSRSMKLTEIRIRCGRLIDGIQAVYQYPAGHYWVTPLYGGNGGKLYSFKLRKDEYITKIYGTYDRILASIIIVTNQRSSLTYGNYYAGSHSYIYEAPLGSEIVGFFGRSGNLIDCLGVYINPFTESCGSGKIYDCDGNCIDDYRIYNWIGDGYCDNENSYINLNCYWFNFDRGDCNKPFQGLQYTHFSSQNSYLGPSGGAIGKREMFVIEPKDIFQMQRIRKIIIRAGKYIDGIQIVYGSKDRELYPGGINYSKFFGGKGGLEYVFSLDRDEYIVSIYGKYGVFVDSLTIRTNKKTSRKYGGNGGSNSYEYTAPENMEISGFIGYSDKYINALGAVVRPIRTRCSENGAMFDCNGKCFNEDFIFQQKADGKCDNGEPYGINLNCVEFNFDGKDCIGEREY